MTTSPSKSTHKQRKSAQGHSALGDGGEDLGSGLGSSTSDTDTKVSDTLLGNEMRAHKNRGFHDGYDAGKKATLQGAYDSSYKKAFEQNFILSTLKGVANALKSSHRNHMQQLGGQQSQSRPTSAISASPSTSSASSTPTSSVVRRGSSLAGCATSTTSASETDCLAQDNPQAARSNHPASSTATSSAATRSSGRRQSSPFARVGSGGVGGGPLHSTASSVGGDDVASTCSSSSISSNRSSTAGYCSSTNVSISSNHLSLLDSMKFDATSDIESIKKDLIKICRENRLEILAHYVSQIG